MGAAGTIQYDAAGNLTYDTATGGGSRTYDAEGRMTGADGSGFWNRYAYDADGKRIRHKSFNSPEVWYVYGMDGELLAEYAANSSPSSPQKEYGYRAGELLVTAEGGGTVRWLVADHLGTPRITVDQTGSLAGVKRHDYAPFGEELYAGVGGRTTNQGYVGDNLRFRYTTYERDFETNLDYAQARYYASAQGRFTSPDPLLASGKVLQPQSWNRYSYVLNNPLKFVDPLGLIWGFYDKDGKRYFQWFDGDKVGEGYTAYTDPYYDSRDGRLYLNPNGPAGLVSAGSEGGGLFTINIDPYIRNGWMIGPTPEQYANYMKSGAVEDASWDIVGIFIPGRMGTKALGATLATKAATEAAETGTTTLYRAVSHAEFEQIMKDGVFKAGPNSAAFGKYFAESAEDAARWGEKMEGKGNFRVVDATIPTVKANEFMRWERLDNIGPARYAELPQLNGAVIRPNK